MSTDFVPEVFGRLTTLDTGYFVYYGVNNAKRCKWHKVRCICGTEKAIRRCSLVRGDTKSCGCYQKEKARDANTTHGQGTRGKVTAEYRAWQQMIKRCYNKKSTRYCDWGGRGIRVFAEWLGPGGFERWLAHIGPRPSKKHSQERKHNDKDYEPGNVYWATDEEQCNNRRSSRFITHNGETKTLMQWSRATGIGYGTISQRLKKGMSVEDALTTPVDKSKSGNKKAVPA